MKHKRIIEYNNKEPKVMIGEIDKKLLKAGKEYYRLKIKSKSKLYLVLKELYKLGTWMLKLSDEEDSFEARMKIGCSKEYIEDRKKFTIEQFSKKVDSVFRYLNSLSNRIRHKIIMQKKVSSIEKRIMCHMYVYVDSLNVAVLSNL